ncbi:MAG TPA: GntR family transcriptional regulator, partial [Sphaerochaeta sp.]|nr:GntR family transcriptional regulator [Sphaerochaeta sp.]
AQLGVSRTPVREAFSRLANEALLVIYPQIGTCVAPIDPAQVQEARFTRLIIEKAVIEIACNARTDEDVAWLEVNLAKQKALVDCHDYVGFLELDNLFHRRLFTISNMELTRNLIQGLLVHFDRVRALYLRDMDFQRTIGEHEMILSALQKKDCTEAVAVIELHLTRVLTDMDALTKRYPEYFVSNNTNGRSYPKR